MNWGSIAFDWNHVRAFLATVEEGSLSAAARALGQTQATLSRQVAALEDDLEVQLFDRIGKRLVLTRAGEDVLSAVKDMATSAQSVALTASGESQSLRGRVVITATDGLAASVLPRILYQERAATKDILIDLRETIDVMDLSSRDADIAIRHVRANNPDYVATHVGDVTAYLCASKTLIKTLGKIDGLGDLKSAPFIGLGRLDDMMEWFSSAGLHLTVENFAMVVQSGVVQAAMVREGCGVSVMTLDSTQEGPIQAIRPDLFQIAVPVWVSAHRKRLMSRRVRVIYDLLAKELTKQFHVHGDIK